MSNVRDLIDVKLYEELSKLLKKEEKKPKPWYDMQLTGGQLVKVYLLMLLAYPFLGALVKMLLQKVL